MTFNTELADQLIGVIEGYPERHRQAVWVADSAYGSTVQKAFDCGTPACVAGRAALLRLPRDWVLADDYALSPDACDVRSYQDIGREALGITRDQADWLFEGWRSREQVLFALKWLRDNPHAGYWALGTEAYSQGLNDKEESSR